MSDEMVSQRLPGIERDSPRHRRIATLQSDPETIAENDVLRQLDMAAPKRHQVEQMHRFAGLGIGLGSVLAEDVLSHPCIVLRRQCQVHHDSEWFHLTPFTLIPTIYNIQRHQSATTLWKGIVSSFVVRGIFLASEAAISEFTPFPAEVSRHSSLKKLGQHLVLKGVCYIVTTPFFAASLVETVQSEIASERPGVLDCVKEGFTRLVGLGGPQTTRLLPVWKLIVPTVVYGLCHYTVKSVAQFTMLALLREKEDDELNSDQTEKTTYHRYYQELLATFTGSLLADMMLYPLETVLHRLHLQGTRTIIDNTDLGLGVVPITTRYEGVLDCCRSILLEEGFCGFFKGYGALILQFTIHAAILKLAQFLFVQLTQDPPKPKNQLKDRLRVPPRH